MKRSKTGLLLTLAFSFLFVSCKESSTSTNIDGNDSKSNVEKIIGSEGGEIISNDNIIKLSIPEGALDEDTKISISIAKNLNTPGSIFEYQEGPTYQLEPDGLVFKKPSQLVIDLNSYWNEFDLLNSAILHWSDKTKSLSISTIMVDELSNDGRILLESFSFLSPIKTPGNSNGWRVFDTKWVVPTLKWYIGSDNVLIYDEENVQKAFDEWEKYVGLNFKKAENKNEAQIVIVELSNDEPFECPGLNIKHATGMICPDESSLFEDSMLDENNRIQIFLNTFAIASSDEPNIADGVLLHEIGHAIGIAHPGFVHDPTSLGGFDYCSESVMVQGAPFFSELQTCDIAAVQYLYGNSGINCGEVLLDIDGNEYETVQIGEQCWMAENLNTSNYKDGSKIRNIIDNDNWDNYQLGAWSYFNHDEKNSRNGVGKLYNWNAVNSRNGICPDGWHVPTDDEWKTLELYLGMPITEFESKSPRGSDQNVGGKLKTTGIKHLGTGLWRSPNYGATNESGFSANPGGHRLAYPADGENPFRQLTDYARWWTSTESSPHIIIRSVYSYGQRTNPNGSGIMRSPGGTKTGRSIRCIKN